MIHIVLGIPNGKSEYIKEHKSNDDLVVNWEEFYMQYNKRKWFYEMLKGVREVFFVLKYYSETVQPVDLWIELYSSNSYLLKEILLFLEDYDQSYTNKEEIEIDFIGSSKTSIEERNPRKSSFLFEEQSKIVHDLASSYYCGRTIRYFYNGIEEEI